MNAFIKNTILSKIESPADLRNLSSEELIKVCEDIREYIIEVVSNYPGHLGANLGTIELAVALHYSFNTPYDNLVWDVGHQAYAHKIITGRKDIFPTNRKYKGISGFPKMNESEYDSFGVGHSSTSISAALGMAIASELMNEPNKHHIAVIGDGSMTGGMAFEALNQAGTTNSNLLVILNDNGIAIDESVGALKEYLTDITTSYTYNKIKETTWNLLGGKTILGSQIRSWIKRLQSAIKIAILYKSNYFESMNFRYFGPVDGHDVVRLTKILEDLKDIKGPKLLHCITVKGKGFSQAEKDRTKFHSPGKFNKSTGEIIDNNKEDFTKYQDVFGHTIVDLARKNDKIVGITPAMATGCSLNIMMKEMPDRVFDVGIAEQHAVTFSAGMAAKGMIPFCNIYSSFAQRAYDQIIHDVALQKLQVVICLDRSGIVGEDGPTHHGVFDLAFLNCIPDLIISSPMNEVELRNMMFTAQNNNHGPFVIRYPRGKGVMKSWRNDFEEIEVGKSRVIRDGNDIAIISIGPIGNNVVKASDILIKDNISVKHIDLRFLKPLDTNKLHDVCKKFKYVITVEDGVLKGGMGSSIIEFVSENDYNVKIRRIGIIDEFVEHGSIDELYSECKMSIDDIVKSVREIII